MIASNQIATSNPATLPSKSKQMSWVSAIVKDDVMTATDMLNDASFMEKQTYLEGMLIARIKAKKSSGRDPDITTTRYCPETAW